MDPIPALGAVPAVGGIDKAETQLKPTDTTAVPDVEKTLEKPAEEKPLEEKSADVKPVEEKKDESASATKAALVPAVEPAKLGEPPVLAPPADASAPDASVADAPKSASVEEVPDKDGPTTSAVEEPRGVSSKQPVAVAAAAAAPAAVPATETVAESVEEPIAQKPAKEPVAEDVSLKEPIIEKPGAVNGAATKDTEMTGALNEAEPSGSGEREAVPQAIPPEAKTGDKRKADDLETANGTNGTVEEEPEHEEKPAEKKARTGRPGRPPSNGATKGSAKKDSPKKGKESLGHKVAENVKKVLAPAGRTARKTRSQGPA